MIEKVFESSWNPEKVSLTIRGMLMGTVPAFVFIARYYGLEGVDENFLTGVFDQAAAVIQQATALIAMIMVLVGLLRKPFAPLQ